MLDKTTKIWYNTFVETAVIDICYYMSDNRSAEKNLQTTDYYPSPTEIRRIILAAQGLTNGEIAWREGVSIETVRSQMSSLRRKTGKQTKGGVILELQRVGLLVWNENREMLVAGDDYRDLDFSPAPIQQSHKRPAGHE